MTRRASAGGHKTELIRSAPPAPLTNDACRRHPARHCRRNRQPEPGSLRGGRAVPSGIGVARPSRFSTRARMSRAASANAAAPTYFRFSGDVSKLCGFCAFGLRAPDSRERHRVLRSWFERPETRQPRAIAGRYGRPLQDIANRNETRIGRHLQCARILLMRGVAHLPEELDHGDSIEVVRQEGA